MQVSNTLDDGSESFEFVPIQVISAPAGMTAVFGNGYVQYPVIALGTIEKRYRRYDKDRKEVKSLCFDESDFDAICIDEDGNFFTVLLAHCVGDCVFHGYAMNGKLIDFPALNLDD